MPAAQNHPEENRETPKHDGEIDFKLEAISNQIKSETRQLLSQQSDKLRHEFEETYAKRIELLEQHVERIRKSLRKVEEES
jgi:hypothetical protein